MKITITDIVDGIAHIRTAEGKEGTISFIDKPEAVEILRDVLNSGVTPVLTIGVPDEQN